MSDGSKIEWTDETWNPTTGCDKVSPGCGLPRSGGDDTGGCYAMAMANRLKGMGQAKYQNDGDPRTPGPGFGLTVHPGTLTLPLHWREPRRIFVNSMPDLFHDKVPGDFIARTFAVMASAQRHTFQVLTKRHARMRSLLSAPAFQSAASAATADLLRVGQPDFRALGEWPLPNVWLGVSVEDQKWFDIRVPALLDTPAAVRFLCCEPLLGPVDLKLTGEADGCTCAGGGEDSGCMHERHCGPEPGPSRSKLHWIIGGGESGPGARPMRPEWARSLRDQCQAAGVPFFFRQWGSHRQFAHPVYDDAAQNRADRGIEPQRVSEKLAGRELDGRTWDEFPRTAAAVPAMTPRPAPERAAVDQAPAGPAAQPGLSVPPAAADAREPEIEAEL